MGVGFHQDPEDAPGLAHLLGMLANILFTTSFVFCSYCTMLEHMLFQGTEKYPESDAFSSFLSEHGGKSNAHTCMYLHSTTTTPHMYLFHT